MNIGKIGRYSGGYLINMTIKEKKEELIQKFDDADFEPENHNYGGEEMDRRVIKSFLSTALDSLEETVRNETIRNYKPVISDIYATTWLTNKYGLEPGDRLNAGEVSELLQTFIDEHIKAR